MPVLSRYTVKEVASHMLGVLLVVLGVFLLGRFSSLLADAIEGSLPSSVVFILLGLRTIMALPSLLPVTLYLGVMLGLGRLHQDHEMTALEACGVPPNRVHASVLRFALLFAVVVGVLSFSVRPWAANRFDTVKKEAVAKSGLANMSPGRFYEVSSRGEQVLFADARSEDDSRYMENVFVQQRKGQDLAILFAKRAMEWRDDAAGYRFLTLLEGYRYDLDPGGMNEEITSYEELTIRTPIDGSGFDGDEQKTRSAAALWASDDPEDQAELQWRLAMPISALLLALLAIPLGRISPRQGKYARFATAIFLYVGYRSLLSTARNWVADGTLAVFPGLWPIHLLCLVTALALLYDRPPGHMPLRPPTEPVRA
jgi:lipopolysaccharide export system permease protein